MMKTYQAIEYMHGKRAQFHSVTFWAMKKKHIFDRFVKHDHLSWFHGSIMGYHLLKLIIFCPSSTKPRVGTSVGISEHRELNPATLRVATTFVMWQAALHISWTFIDFVRLWFIYMYASSTQSIYLRRMWVQFRALTTQGNPTISKNSL